MTREEMARYLLEMATTIRAIKRESYEHDATELFDISDVRKLQRIAAELRKTVEAQP